MRTEKGQAKFFNMFAGVRQGCILSPLSCLLVGDFVMRKAIEEKEPRLKWTGGKRLTDLDGIALLAVNEIYND